MERQPTFAESRSLDAYHSLISVIRDWDASASHTSGQTDTLLSQAAELSRRWFIAGHTLDVPTTGDTRTYVYLVAKTFLTNYNIAISTPSR